MNLIHPFRWLEIRRYKALWSDPERSLMTLVSFADTEEDGGKDLIVASKRFTDAEILVHLNRHAKDEIRHASLFRNRASEKAGEQARHIGAKHEKFGRAFELSGQRGPDQVNAHGFFKAGLIDEMGEVSYIAMVNVAEQKAAALFERHRRAAAEAGDPATAEIFAAILRDEKYHAAWTHSTLERWRKEGRGAEVDRAVKSAGRSRFFDAWRRKGLRSASGFIRILLMLAYWTILAPFGLISRLRRPANSAWAPSRHPSQTTSQY